MTEFEEQFWPHVPTKIGKGAAREAFLKARTGKGKHTEPSDLQTILDGLPGFAAYENQRAQQDGYRPLHPSTWLNQERWTDQPVAEGGRATRICTHWDDGTPIPAGHPIHGNRWPAEIQGTNGTPWRVTTDGAVLKHEGGAWRRQGVIRKTNP